VPIRLLVFLLEHFPWLRRQLWRWWYNRLAQRHQAGDWTFMNYGFVPPAGDSAPALALEGIDEPDRLCIQLYHRVASTAELLGRDVLEVGSGRGGGASFLARYHRPARMTGVDFSPQAVALCEKRHAGVAHLAFRPGDAEALPFPDASFDIVLNVESSHCYGHVEKFFAEAARVLRPGGWFLYTDFRAATDVAAWHAALAAQPAWVQTGFEDITAAVADALQADDERKRALIREFIPARFQPLFGEFAGLVGGQMYAGFRAREILYHRFAFRKKPPTS
ncbi:MAG: class I SAM-dependent methyltransferase, partial [Lacunisphaera sp.]